MIHKHIFIAVEKYHWSFFPHISKCMSRECMEDKVDGYNLCCWSFSAYPAKVIYLKFHPLEVLFRASVTER